MQLRQAQFLFVLFAFSSFHLAAQVTAWVKEAKSDPLRGTQFLEFTIDGRFLTAPKNLKPNVLPMIKLRCTPGSFTRGHQHGKIVSAFIPLGAVVDSRPSSLGTVVDVSYRLDDSKVHKEPWGVSTDLSAISLGETELDTILYAHFTPHKENTTPPVRKLVLAFNEYLGGEVVVQFDMPEPSEVAEACGVVWHK